MTQNYSAQINPKRDLCSQVKVLVITLAIQFRISSSTEQKRQTCT